MATVSSSRGGGGVATGEDFKGGGAGYSRGGWHQSGHGGWHRIAGARLVTEGGTAALVLKG